MTAGSAPATLIIALWGSLTGTIALAFKASEFFSDRHDLKLRASMQHHTAYSKTRRRKRSLAFQMAAVNHGRRSIKIQMAGIELPIGRSSDCPITKSKPTSTIYYVYDGDDQGIIELKEDDKHIFRIKPFPPNYAEILNDEGTAFVIDTKGRKYKTTFIPMKL